MTLQPRDTSFIHEAYEAADNLDIEGVQEFISRPARKRIALAIAKALLIKEREEGNKRQSCNAYTERLIKSAATHAPEDLVKILNDDIATYQREVRQLIESMLQGGATTNFQRERMEQCKPL